MKKTILFLALVALTGSVFAQKKTTTAAVVAFDATTPKDKFPKAENKTGIASIDTKSGAIAFEVAVANFAFENPKIQEHFNSERWLNSAAFKSFSYKGKLKNTKAVNFTKDGTYTAEAEGELTVKDKKQTITTPVTIVVAGKSIKATSEFNLTLADYGVMADGEKISKTPKVTVNAEFK